MHKNSMVVSREDCRLCGSLGLELALPMRPSAIGDAYVTKEKITIEQKSYPLSLYLCKQCSHLQLPTVINPQILFSDYIYLTSTSPGLVEHFRQYAKEVMEISHCNKDALVVEIGSNDGSLLKFFKESGMRTVGIDPARDIAQKANESGIETINAFFSLDIAKRIKAEKGSASIITANNVFAHIDNMDEILRGVEYLLDAEGVFVFEVSYLVDMIEKNVFDTIYHEHLCHHRVEPLEKFFNKYNMCFFDIKRISTKGGSIRGFVKRKNSTKSISPVIQLMIKKEKDLALDNVQTYQNFAIHLEKIKNDLHSQLNKFKNEKKSIVGFGASTPVTTTIFHFEIGPYFEYIIDDNPIKQGRFSPGLHIPIVSSEALYTQKPDCVVILAWQYADIIMTKHKQFLKNGGCFIVPIPEVKTYYQTLQDTKE